MNAADILLNMQQRLFRYEISVSEKQKDAIGLGNRLRS